MTPNLTALIALGLSALALAGPARAQLSSQGGPIQVDADNGEIRDREKKAVYFGNVDVIQGDARLRADRIEVLYSGGGEGSGLGGSFGELSSIIATGQVFYVTPDFKARGNKGTYDAPSGTITLEGEVIVSRGEDVATGQKLVLLLSEGRSVLTGGQGERVRTTLTPQGTPESTTPAPAPANGGN
jgi:lipopolysaccharide export system protein LptA